MPAITNSNFEVAYASGKKPPQDTSGGWELEESLDVEMLHAMAPGAKVVLLEAASASLTDLLAAEVVAGKMAAPAGGGKVSNSWGRSESSSESSYESNFVAANVVFIALSGNSPGPEFPSVLQNVIAGGGTSINHSSTYDFASQTTWSDAGAGSSSYIAVPS